MVRPLAALAASALLMLLPAGCSLGHRVEMIRSSHPPVGRPLAVRADLPEGKMQVSMGNPTELYNLAFSYCKDHFRPLSRFEADGSKAGLPGTSLLEAAAMPLHEDTEPGSRVEPNLMRLLLRPGVPLDLRFSAGTGEMDLDLSALGISRLALHGGGDMRVRFQAGNPRDLEEMRVVAGRGSVRLEGLGWGQVAKLEFHGGAGGATLDWSGPGPPNAEAFLDPGTGSLSLIFPADLGVALSGNGIRSDPAIPGFQREGAGWVSSNSGQAQRHLALILDPGEGPVRFSWKR